MLCVLAWLYIAMGAGTGMSALKMTTLSLFPHESSSANVASTSWSLATWTVIVAMWWVMMIAMMGPSAAPAILLYGMAHRQAVTQGQARERLGHTGAFAAGYLLIWLGFSMAVTALQWAFESVGLISAMMMGSQSRWLSGGVLVAAGLYQLSPVKQACLGHCRAPAAFLSRHWRPHASGALRMGLIHGAYCVGCCWMLMALLFVGGVMNLLWIAALSVLVLIEKVLPAGRWVGQGCGLVLIGWGIATFFY